MARRAFLLRLLLIVSLAFAGRALYILAVTQHLEVSQASVGARRSFDEVYYERQAKQIADGVWFKDAELMAETRRQSAAHPPLAALVLAPVAGATGGSVLAMRFTMAVAGAGVVALAGLIGRQVGGGTTGLWAASLAAVYPNLWMNDGLVLSETLAALCTAAVIFTAYRLVRRPSWHVAAGMGVAAGAGMLSRSELVLLVPLLVIPVALSVRSRAGFTVAVVAIATTAATVAPWVVYNLSRFEEPVLLSHGDGGVLAGANCDSTYHGELIGLWNGYCGSELGGDPADRSVEAAEKRSLALSYVRDNLERVPAVTAARLGRIWSVYRPFQMNEIAQAEGRPQWASTAGLVMFWALVPLSAFGVAELRRRMVPLLPLLAPVLAGSLTGVVLYGLLRFRTVAEVSFVVLAAVAFCARLRGDGDTGPAVGRRRGREALRWGAT